MFLDAACMMQVCTPKCADSCCASGMPGSHRLQSCIVHEPCSVGFLFILIDDGNALSKQRGISPMEWKHIWIKSVREQQRNKQQQHFDYHAMFLFIIFNRSAMLSRKYFTEIVFGSIFFFSLRINSVRTQFQRHPSRWLEYRITRRISEVQKTWMFRFWKENRITSRIKETTRKKNK